MGNEPLRTGEIVVYNADAKAIPVVHRIIQVHERQDSDYVDILTKVLMMLDTHAPALTRSSCFRSCIPHADSIRCLFAPVK